MTTRSLETLANPFQFSQRDIRTAVDDNGEVWFCAKDVFEALGIAWKGSKGSLMNCQEKWQMVWYLQTSFGEKEMIFISEAAVYQTTFRSNKPEAVAFAEWVCEEVLPTIRRQGFFGKLDGKHRLACSKQIVEIGARLTATKDAMYFSLLLGELRDLCNLIGKPIPKLDLLGKDSRQLSLFEEETP